jgi:nucleoside-diphosphate-sugar epimerase
MRILVTGRARFVGSNLAVLMAERRCSDVVAFDNLHRRGEPTAKRETPPDPAVARAARRGTPDGHSKDSIAVRRSDLNQEPRRSASEREPDRCPPGPATKQNRYKGGSSEDPNRCPTP